VVGVAAENASGASIALRAAWQVAGGLGIGTLVGFVGAAALRRQREDHFVATCVTLLIAYGSYLVAGRLRASAILSVVAAGFVFGNRVREPPGPVDNFWEMLAFAANSLVFLLVGLDLDPAEIGRNAVAILVVSGALVLTRVVIVYGSSSLLRSRLPPGMRPTLVLGGMRGALSMALALGLPPSPARTLVIQLTFGVVVFTLLQGLVLAITHPRLMPSSDEAS
jgi:CPA1 family monovalent cation:H+ antiporter